MSAARLLAPIVPNPVTDHSALWRLATNQPLLGLPRICDLCGELAPVTEDRVGRLICADCREEER